MTSGLGSDLAAVRAAVGAAPAIRKSERSMSQILKMYIKQVLAAAVCAIENRISRH
jgi:hypothetical protein